MCIIKIINHIVALLKMIFYKIIYGSRITFGKRVTFRKGMSIAIENEGKIIIGNGVFFNNYCSLNSLKEIRIGDNSIFGENVKIYDHNHTFKYKNKLIKSAGFKSDKILIGNNCWIGSNVIILKSVSIGDNSVISAGEIVRKSVPGNSILKDGIITSIEYQESEK